MQEEDCCRVCIGRLTKPARSSGHPGASLAGASGQSAVVAWPAALACVLLRLLVGSLLVVTYRSQACCSSIEGLEVQAG